MKKYSLIILFSMICTLFYAQTIEQSYTFSTPSFQTIRGYEQLHFDGCMQSALAGQPSLPWQSVSLMLPEGQEAESIEVILSGFQELEGSHLLFPFQPARRYSDPEHHEFVIDEALYQSKAAYPEQVEGKLTTQYMNGVGFAFCTFTPVQYEPATGKVRYATKAKVVVKTTASKADQSRKLWLTPDNRQRIASLAQNPEMLQTYQSRGREVAGYELLVITTEPYVSQFDDYVAFYEARGLRTRVVSVNSIYAQMTGVDNPEKIRNYIIQEYENNGIMMVNLGGDVPDIPYRSFYCYVISGGGNQEDNLPADLYYAALDGNWNDDGDNRWGEEGEDDLLPEIGVGRMCFSDQNEFNNMMHKGMSYQENPVLGEFHKVIMGGEHLYDNPTSNGSQYLELLIGERSDNGYTTIGIPEDYQFTRLYEEEGNWSGSLLRNAINQGTQYVHHDGHANTTYVAGWYNSDITDSNFSGADGVTHNYTFFHTSGCICGDFTSNCILEKMTKISNFAVATIGNSRYGWFNEGQTEGPAIHLHRETEDAYYHERIPYSGLALTEAKIQTAPWVNAPGQWEQGALRWNFYDLNLMGDVAVSPWHDEPFTPDVIYQDALLLGAASTTVTVTAPNGDRLKNFRCSIFHEDEMVGYALTNDEGVAEITFETPIDFVGEMRLIVTGCDAWPQQLDMMALPNNAAYVIYDAYTFSGDANGQADFGENVSLLIGLRNVGNITANNVTATLSTESDYVTITDNTAYFGVINGNQSATTNDTFSFTVSDAVPDMTSALFFLNCTDGTDTWTSKFLITLHAPKLVFLTTTMTEAAGNGNGVVEPGETITAHFSGLNEGSSAAPGTVFALFNNLPEITFNEHQYNVGLLEAGASFQCDLTFTLSENSELGVAYKLPISLYSGNYITNDYFIFTVGKIMEGFETGDFSAFNWHHGSVVTAWEVVTHNSYEGSYSAESADIDDYETSILYIDLDIAADDEISFYYKVSSEHNYDKLIFSIDDAPLDNWSGEVSWTRASFGISAGHHRLEWRYSKDISLSSGSDCAWIDNIVFPPTTTITKVESYVTGAPNLYPNPNHGQFQVVLPEEDCTVTVFNSLGQQVYRGEQLKGLSSIDLQHLDNGLYFLNVQSADFNHTQKFIKQ